MNNNSKTQKLGTCRIFIGPKFNERGQPFLLRDLCLMMVEMDKFVVKREYKYNNFFKCMILKSFIIYCIKFLVEPGENHVIRKSIDSSITIPFERTYRNLNKGRGAAGSEQEAKFNFCGCGWPHNMLVPRGKPEGMPVYIYVLISDHLIDKVYIKYMTQ